MSNTQPQRFFLQDGLVSVFNYEKTKQAVTNYISKNGCKPDVIGVNEDDYAECFLGGYVPHKVEDVPVIALSDIPRGEIVLGRIRKQQRQKNE